MRVLLVSTYELGHQPWHLATTAGFLRDAGHDVAARDLAVDELDDAGIDSAELVAIAVPMHTAARLAASVVERVRRRRGSSVQIALVGLYAQSAASMLPPEAVDAAIAGEFEAELTRLADGAPPSSLRPLVLDRLHFPPPDRTALPPLERYARLLVHGEERLAGYLEASRGCVHRCRHCPVPVVYGGRIRIVQREAVVEDACRLWEMGARHLTLGDPDFLNAVPHALGVARALHARLPALSFDITTKIEHILEHPDVVAELRSLGLLFVVSAIESVDDEVLRILDKGHTSADTLEALALLRGLGVELRPSLLPFTPWSGLRSYLDLLDFVARCDLVDSVDPVQLGIRLLLPRGSLLLEQLEMLPYLAGTSELGETLWRHRDPAMDELAARVATLIAAAADAEEQPRITHQRVRDQAALAAAAAGIAWSALPPAVEARWRVAEDADRPRLSEAWFCCAEPTSAQLERVPLAHAR